MDNRLTWIFCCFFFVSFNVSPSQKSTDMDMYVRVENICSHFNLILIICRRRVFTPQAAKNYKLQISAFSWIFAQMELNRIFFYLSHSSISLLRNRYFSLCLLLNKICKKMEFFRWISSCLWDSNLSFVQLKLGIRWNETVYARKWMK